ncbi:MAG TPA: hypothetical protein VGM46_11360 [Mesorhizobium sp.]
MPNPETERQRTEQVLRELLAEAQAAEGAVEESRDFLLSGLFSKNPADTAANRPQDDRSRKRKPGKDDMEWPQPPQAQFPKPAAKADRRSDLVVAALGITLGLICAMFPWYIFYNQVQFHTHGFRLGGNGERSGRIVTSAEPRGDAAPLSEKDLPMQKLDLFATGTPAESRQDPAKTPGLDEQPFPAGNDDFRLVHVANGRAMIEDDAGVWIVQAGSTLPDNSRVTSIEKRAGKWVLVTSKNQVVGLTQ